MITKRGKLCTMGEHQKKRHGKWREFEAESKIYLYYQPSISACGHCTTFRNDYTILFFVLFFEIAKFTPCEI